MDRLHKVTRRTGLAFLAMVSIALVIGGISLFLFRDVIAEKDRVISVYSENLIAAATIGSLAERTIAANRGYVISGDPSHLGTALHASKEFDRVFIEIQEGPTTSDEEVSLNRIDLCSKRYRASIGGLIALRDIDATSKMIEVEFREDAVPRARELRRAVESYVDLETAHLNAARESANAAAKAASLSLTIVTFTGTIAAMFLAVTFTRVITRQLSLAMSSLRGAWSELQEAAYVQSRGARKQVATIKAIDLKIKEVVTAVKELAESAHQIEEATEAIQNAESLSKSHGIAFKRQIDRIESQANELRYRANEIEAILQATTKLSEETNVAAFNASLNASRGGMDSMPLGVGRVIRFLSSQLQSPRFGDET